MCLQINCPQLGAARAPHHRGFRELCRPCVCPHQGETSPFQALTLHSPAATFISCSPAHSARTRTHPHTHTVRKGRLFLPEAVNFGLHLLACEAQAKPQDPTTSARPRPWPPLYPRLPHNITHPSEALRAPSPQLLPQVSPSPLPTSAAAARKPKAGPGRKLITEYHTHLTQVRHRSATTRPARGADLLLRAQRLQVTEGVRSARRVSPKVTPKCRGRPPAGRLGVGRTKTCTHQARAGVPLREVLERAQGDRCPP